MIESARPVVGWGFVVAAYCLTWVVLGFYAASIWLRGSRSR